MLSVIDEAVRARPGPPGFEGHLCFVERGARGDRYWHLDAEPKRVTFGFRDDVPIECTTLFVFDESGEPSSFRLSGDRRSLSAMLERYLGGSTWLALRAGGRK